MVGQHQPMPVGRKPDQREANERRCRKIEALGTLLRQNIGQALRTRGVIQR